MGEGKDGGGAGERRGVGGRSEYRKKAGGRGSTSAPAMGGLNPACFDAHSYTGARALHRQQQKEQV